MSTDKFAAFAAADPEAAALLVKKLQKRLVVPHAGGQDKVAASLARFRAVRAGRRFGKTKLAAREILAGRQRGALTVPGSMNWWVANTYRNVRRGYREVVRQLPPELLAKEAPPSTSNELILQLKNGSIIEFYSGGNPDAMAGEGVDFVVVDEAALQADIVWSQTIRPTLLDTEGHALLISTPRGRNWFYDLWQRGQGGSPLYESWHFTTADSPYVSAEELEDLKASLPERLYRQEILAEALSNADAIFNLDNVFTVAQTADPAGHISMGVDLAKHQDFTVITASREDGLPVWHERFQNVSWPEQRERIKDAAEFLLDTGGESITIGIDTTGIGDVIYDDLDEEGFDVEPVTFTNTWKHKAVKLLGSDLEQRRAVIMEDALPEFESFEYAITAHGNMTYQAAQGKHDDEVTAKLVEHWVRRHAGPGAVHVEDLAALEDQEAEEEGPPLKPRSTRELMNDPAVWTSA